MARGALVVSLDFELAWGVLDVLATRPAYAERLAGAREAVPRLLERFERHGVAATWAAVGLLFAASREEREAFAPPPELRPRARDPRLDPYRVPVGADEVGDPLHFAPSLLRRIAATPRQRVGSHGFAHLNALDAGVDADVFEADLRAARAIAAARGLRLASYVWPGHRYRADFLPLLARQGFTVQRGPQAGVLHRPRWGSGGPLPVRAARLADSYLNLTGHGSVAWPAGAAPREGAPRLPLDVPESLFLRPASARLARLEPLRVARVTRAMRHAAETGTLLHLWWHPHNFGGELEANLRNLDAILATFDALAGEHGFASYAMEDVAEVVGAEPASVRS